MAVEAGNFAKFGERNKERKKFLVLVAEFETPVSPTVPPSEATSSTPDPPRAVLTARVAAVRVFKASAKYGGTALSNNTKYATAGTLEEEARVREDWDLAATRNSEAVHLRAALAKVTS